MIRLPVVTLALILPATAVAQNTVTITSPIAILEPSSSSPSDRDGYPPTSGSADPEEGTLAVRLVVTTPIADPFVVVTDIDADGIDDLRIEELGATTASAARSLDDLDGVIDGQLAPGTWVIYFNLEKTGYKTNLPASAATSTFKNDIEQFRVRLTGSNITPVDSPLFTVTLEGSASVNQNDLRWLETAPSEIRAAVGDVFSIRTKYSHSSAGGVDAQVLQTFINGTAIRVEEVRLYYYDTDGAAIGSVATNVPAGWDAVYVDQPHLTAADYPASISSGDRWVTEFTFRVVGPGGSAFLPYFQTKPNGNSNWKVDSGYTDFGSQPPGEINPAELQITKVYASGGRPVSGPEPPVVDLSTMYRLEIEIANVGFDEAIDVVVQDFIPPGVDFLGGLNPSQGTTSYDASVGRILWTVGPLDPDMDGPGPGVGGSAILTFDVGITPSMAQVGLRIPLNNGADALGVSLYSGRTITAGPTPPLFTTAVQAGEPRLDLTKAVNATVAQPADQLTYTLSYKNDGNITALQVVLTDELPPRTSFVSSTAGGTYDASTRTVSWSVGDIEAGESGTVTFVVGLDSVFPSGQTAVINRGNASSSNALSVVSNDVTTIVEASPRVSVVKAVDRVVAAPGDRLIYTLAYDNSGRANATGVVISDPLPPRTSFVSATAGGAFDGTNVVWSIGALPVGASGSVSFTVSLDPVFPAGMTWVRNRASYVSDQTPTALSNQVATTVDAAPVLTLTKSVDRAVASPGDLLTYALTLSNGGDAAASAVVINDALPSRATFVSASDGGVVLGGTATWGLGTLPAGDVRTVTLVVRLDAVFPAGTTVVTNSATVISAETPLATSNPANTEVTATPQLMVTKVVDKAAAQPGDTLTYTLTYSNAGNAEASGVVVTDALPARTTFVSASGGVAQSGTTVSWSVGSVAPSASGTLTLVVRLDAVFPNGTTIVTNVAVIQSTQTPPTTSGPARTTVSASPALTLVKAVDAATARPGQTLTYTLSYANTGDADASAVFVSDALPPRTTFVSASGGGTASGNVVNWTLGALPSGATGTLTIVVRLDATFPNGTTLIENVAVVDSAQTAAVTSNRVTTEVTAGPLLRLVKSVDRVTARSGDLLTYTLIYANDGDADATQVAISDEVPAFSTFVAATHGGVFGAAEVTWPVGTVAAGGTGTVSFTVVLDAVFVAGSTDVMNIASVSSAEQPSLPSNAVVTVVEAAPALTLTKAVDRGAANPGDTVTYTLSYANLGDADASAVVVADPVPPRTTFLSASASGALVGSVVQWSIGTLAAGGSGSVTFSVQLDAVFPPGTNVVRNVGSIDAAETAPVPSNEVTTSLDASPALAVTKIVDRARASPGQQLTYTLTYTNNGNAHATNAVLRDPIPARTSFVSTSTGATLIGGELVYALGTLAAGTTSSVSFVVQLDAVFPNGETIVTNRGLIQSAETSTTPSNEVQTSVRAAPTLTLAKAVDRAVAAPAQLLTYTLTYTNTGDAAAEGVVIDDTLPPRTTFVSASDSGTPSGSDVRWVIGAVPAGASASVTLTVALDAVFPNGRTIIRNAGTIDSDTTAPVASNEVQTAVDAAPALVVLKTVDRAAASPGDLLTYTLTYSNVGSAAASMVTLTDALPPRTTFESATDGGVSSGGSVLWSLGSVAAGQSATVEFTARLDSVFPNGTTLVFNSAVATGVDAAAVASNIVTTAVEAAPSVTVVKAVDRASARPGTSLTYSLAYGNSGDADATDVVLSDVLPARTTFVSADAGGTFDGTSVRWSVGPLASGASGTVRFTVTLDAVFPAGATAVTNVAIVTLAETPATNSNEVTTTVDANPDLVITKAIASQTTRTITLRNVAVAFSAQTSSVSSDVATLSADEVSTVTYRVEVANIGDADATGVVIEDTLDGAVEFVSASAGGGYEATGRVVRWTIGDLAAGATSAVELTVAVP